MTLKIMSWNIEGRLSSFSRHGRGTPGRIIAEIGHENADIVFLPEAFDKKQGGAPEVNDSLTNLGYQIYDIPYDDAGPERIDAATELPVLRLLSRVPVKGLQSIRLGGLRNSLVATVTDPQTNQQIRLIGIHLDDRAEKLRLQQLTNLVPLINSSSAPTVMVGDYNAVHGNTRKAAFLRSRLARMIAHHLPTIGLRDFAIRATEMATGTTLATLLSETNLRDVDTLHRPTTTPKVRQHSWLPSIRLLDLDHILVSDDIAAQNFAIARRDGGSDHRHVSAVISLD